ncbi:sodium:solute symporter family protein [Halomonas sp. HP20-15]|uniref:sodium:solute symporter family protein n=1 Tax=Halomonas sp. HP20-15 TaxID=3085901 RepID=UPI0029816FE8|nr:sodium:solute symporter family protein [Halomonas sp. HP20-15]MDW5378502.1 sodium:solute symporter family protein [Halomonas sp. HP20-15]
MTDSLIVTAITLCYLAMVLWVGLRGRGQDSATSLEGYVAGGRHVGVVILFFILGAEIFSAFAFLGMPGWAYQRGAPALYIFAYLGLIPIAIWVMGPRVAELGRRRGYLTQGDLLADHYRSRALGLIAGVIGVLALLPYLTIQIAGAGMLFQAATDGLIPFWLGALLAFLVVAAYVFCSGLGGIGWTNLVQGIMMIVIAWFLGLTIANRLYGGVGEMFTRIQLEMPEYLTLPGATGMGWGAFSTAILISAFGGAMWPHLFMKFYSADSGRSLRQVSVFYPLYAYLLVPLLFIGFAGVLAFADAPLARPDSVLLELVLKVADFSPWVIGLMLSGALAAAMSTGANLAHTAAVVLTRDVLGTTLMRNADERRTVAVTRWCVLGLSLVAYLIALANPASLVLLLLGAYGLIVQLLPMVMGALFFPSLTRASVSLGALLGSLTFLIFQFPVASPFGWHPGVWGLAANLLVVVAVQWLTARLPRPHKAAV